MTLPLLINCTNGYWSMCMIQTLTQNIRKMRRFHSSPFSDHHAKASGYNASNVIKEKANHALLQWDNSHLQTYFRSLHFISPLLKSFLLFLYPWHPRPTCSSPIVALNMAGTLIIRCSEVVITCKIYTQPQCRTKFGSVSSRSRFHRFIDDFESYILSSVSFRLAMY